jgi:hypothetical protein
MKIHITENVDQIIDGYVMMPIVYGKIDMSNIPNNSATEIVADEAIDSIPVEEIQSLFGEIKSKLRLNGRLMVSGTELQVVCQDVLRGKLTTKDFNNVIFNNRGIYTVNEIAEYINSIDLKIETMLIKGNKYEIRATRTN